MTQDACDQRRRVDAVHRVQRVARLRPPRGDAVAEGAHERPDATGTVSQHRRHGQRQQRSDRQANIRGTPIGASMSSATGTP
jgi:hypothetical protein